ncbi:MAG: MRP family ATP-binding protein [Candidatus Reconcilbacillus cellulovorans]|uniref:Iron-sulfur cluster carrier protein n=1 Tax=Candidatus Reconcilbacillus cellulovorans TaxID=1906605 RepID=A0A2A6E3S7_9BACL|nr:MAG: MRP family ATP-binding protein [Candidatus Reconcilbacillus cellulovorans]
MTREQALEALGNVLDPTYGRPLVELQLVRDVVARDGRVSLTLVLTREDEQTAVRLRDEVERALLEAGAASVHVRTRPASEFERVQLARRFDPAAQDGRGRPAQGAPVGRSETRIPGMEGVCHIAIASGKGGVGKSTVTVNLAVALARMGKKTAIVDADIYGFSVPDMMGIEDRPAVENDRILPVERFGVKVMSMGFFVQDNSPVIWRGPMLGKMLRHFFYDVDWGELEYMLLDLPPGTGDVALDVHQLLPESKEILVTTPHETAAFVAARAGAMAIRTQHEILGVVENMSYYIEKGGDVVHLFGKGGGRRLAEELQTELLAQIPINAPGGSSPTVDGAPAVYRPDSEIGRIYEQIARRVVEKTQP